MAYSTKCYEDNFSASGDFSIVTDSSARLSHIHDPNKHLEPIGGEDEDASTSIKTIASPRKMRNSELEDLTKAIEDRIKCSSKEFEEKLLQSFYGLRINTSKLFIGLEEKISQSWSSFVDYLRLSGAASVCNSNEMASKGNLTKIENCSSNADEGV
ncbi:hypothetical protein NQ314_009581 [Rhamnusium bicolor]|uniref:Ovate family protein n=1 Tax=Rhamnusium bicolor TaxID=1586634 RepID=A0AAV8Y1F4_9CUCU|nr:hypothetical protein NQ314_009581 [Rhamnusium bicolor]